jgi:hypothetical protein
MDAEIKRLQVALAETEKRWRQERKSSRVWRKLYESKREPANDCATCRKWLCLVPCPAGERQQERIIESMGGRF